MEPRVSVIVPIYNTEKYLRRCLDSLINQTLDGVQIVAVDDGSTDSSPAILEEYVSKYPDRFLVYRQENSGQAVARNRALDMCEGFYIGFLDSDDYVKPQMFERLYNLAQDRKADYVACGYTDTMIKDGQDVVLKEYVAAPPCKQSRDLYFDALVSPFIHLYRADVFQRSGVKFPEGLIYEDTAFYMNLIPHLNTVACINEPLAYRVRHSHSTMTTISADRVRNIFGVIDDVQKYYKEQDLFFDKFFDYKDYMCVRILLGSNMDRISLVEDAGQRKQLIAETFAYLDKNFPQYKKNRFFTNSNKMKDKILKLLNPSICPFYVMALRIRNMIKGKYE